MYRRTPVTPNWPVGPMAVTDGTGKDHRTGAAQTPSSLMLAPVVCRTCAAYMANCPLLAQAVPPVPKVRQYQRERLNAYRPVLSPPCTEYSDWRYGYGCSPW